MNTTSYNGWPASTDPGTIGVVPFTVAGVNFPGGVRAGDVHLVLHYVLLEFHHRVEPLKAPACWGYSFRPNKNDPNELSCHASGTAADANAPDHPNGVEASETFTPAQIAEIHQILSEIPELDEVVHWGGDWHFADDLTPDAMHWEIHDHDLAKLARVANRIKEKQMLNDLRALAKKYNVSLVKLARRALYGASLNASGTRLAHVNAARKDLKGMN
jgi:hypothetical protein